MSITFTKLFSSITESTVWCEPAHTRLVWITMLAMADRKGRIWASVPGLANRARVPLEDAEKALATFLGPDKYSRTPDNEGRRIEPIDGGWQLLNHAKYRDMRDDEVRREQNREAKKRGRAKSANVLTVSHGQPQSAQAEADTEAKAVSQNPAASPPKDASKEEIWQVGRALLEAEGKSREAAGSFLGKLCKDFGQVLVLQAVRDARRDQPAKPSEWLMARCQERRNAPKSVPEKPAMPCGNCARPLTGTWSQSPKGRVCGPCYRGYLDADWPEKVAA